MKTLLFIVGLTFAGVLDCSAVTDFFDVEDGAVFISPNKRFSATVDLEKNILHIKDVKKVGDVQDLEYLPPLLGVFWLGNSEAFCTVEHLAGGSDLNIQYFEASSWKRFAVDPQDSSLDGFQVIKLITGYDYAIVTYKAYSNSHSNNYIIKMKVRPKNREIKTISIKPITVDDYRNL